MNGGYTVIDRMRRGKRVFVHGGRHLALALTNHRDLARAFVGLMGNPHAIGEPSTSTNDESLTWNRIYQILAQAAGAEAHLVHASSEWIAAWFAGYNSRWGDGIVATRRTPWSRQQQDQALRPRLGGDHPLQRGCAARFMAWYDADPARRVVDPKLDDLFERMLAAYDASLPPVERGVHMGRIIILWRRRDRRHSGRAPGGARATRLC